MSDPAPKKVNPDAMTIKQAAAYLGVSPNTLRNWEKKKPKNSKSKKKRFTANRHPINGYRLYRLKDLKRLKDEIESRIF